MIEDSSKLKSAEKPIHGKKKHVLKKKDIIIAQQNEIRAKKNEKTDLDVIDYLVKNLTDDNIYDNFDKLYTERGKQIYKFKLLCHFIKKQKQKKKDYMSHILNLYFSIKYGKNEYLIEDSKYIKVQLKMDAKLCDYDYKGYMMKELSHLLPPLNFWDKGNIELDDWQVQVIDDIKNKKSVLVKAPTSSGKTFVAMATGIIHKRIIYVCPAKPVVYQVGANFVKMGYKVHYLVENMAHLPYDNRTNIFIGTPETIEKYLPRIYTSFDYAVFDEIHNINDRICYENIIKLVQCNFIALSATLENIDYLRAVFSRIHPQKEIKYVEYKKRFINQQRWIYTDKLEKVHPVTCLDVGDFKTFMNISFTPFDCVALYEIIEDILDEDSLSPDNYFKEDKLLTLDDTKQYEEFIKIELSKLYAVAPNKVNKVISQFKKHVCPVKEDNNDIITFLKSCKSADLLPMLYFHTEETVAQEIFMKIYNELQYQEEYSYPFHYVILEKKYSLYKKYTENRQNYSDGIKIKTNDARTEKQEKLNEYDKEQKNKYISEICNFYDKCIVKCRDKENYKKCISNLKKECKGFMSNPDFREIDIYKKHPDYCFTRGEPMSGPEIKTIRREIKIATGIQLEYENPVFQLLKRGIGLYISSMPDEYNWILQRLMGEKKLGIVISDRTLCLGIDLPIRSVALSGYKSPTYSVSDYLQMSGRAGRRGHDTQGNIIFHGIPNYIDLMKGCLPKLTGSDTMLGPSYSVIESLNKNISLANMTWRINSEDNVLSRLIYPSKVMRLAWSLRYYESGNLFLDKIPTLEKNIFMVDESCREDWLFGMIMTDLFEDKVDIYHLIYKQNKIDDSSDITDILPRLIEMADIVKDMVNLLDDSFMITKNISSLIFGKLRTLVYKYRGFQ
tara:strand:- start:2397 stop:5090 length:2694 start_codon:yes stop_codon:yes gene_type:complete